jgi:hypothetical protein
MTMAVIARREARVGVESLMRRMYADMSWCWIKEHYVDQINNQLTISHLTT